MKIAVIDDGINIGYYTPLAVQEDRVVINNLIKIRNDRKSSHKISHATVCAAIIYKNVENVNIISLKILSDVFKIGTIQSLRVALEYCYDNKIKIINISLGSVFYGDYQAIYSIIKKLVKSGSIIVAALDNMSHYSIPACMDGVIAVASPECGGSYYRNIFYTKGSHLLTTYKNGTETTMESNSYAAAFATSQILNLVDPQTEMDYFEVVGSFVSDPDIHFYKNYFYNEEDTVIVSEDYISSEYHKENLQYPFVTLDELVIDNTKIYKLIIAFNNVEELEKLFDLVTKSHSNIFGIVFLFRIDESIIRERLADKKVFVWEASLQERIIKQILRNQLKKSDKHDLASPVIGLLQCLNIDEAISKIRGFFTDLGYNTMSITRNTSGILFGNYFLDKNCMDLEHLTYLYYEYNFDILLVPFDEEQKKPDCTDFVIDMNEYSGYEDACKAVIDKFIQEE